MKDGFKKYLSTAALSFVALVSGPAASPPSLSIALNGTNVVLSWPQPSEPFVLESKAALDSATAWQPVAETPSLLNQQLAVVLSNTHVNRFFRLRLSQPVPAAFRIESMSPEHGEEMVSPARTAIIRFAGTVEANTVTTNSFYLLANGERVAGFVRVSSTDQFATFVPESPLPPSTAVRLVVNGNLLRGRGGSLLDADGNGVPGGMRFADFHTLPLTRIPGTRFAGFVRDAYTLRPIIGATIRVDAFPEADAVTDNNGRFELVDMPAPEFFVHLDGTTAVNAPPGFTYPSVGKTFHTVPGQAVEFFVVYLPPMAQEDFQRLSSSTNTVVGFGSAGLAELDQMFPTVPPAVWQRMKVNYPPGSAVDEFGNRATEAIIVPVPPTRLPSPLPPFASPRLVISIQAPGATTFDVPAPITFPNLDGLAPGQKSFIYSFNHSADRWEPIGTATVSADGLTQTSDPGVGIRAPGWHFVAPVATGTGGSPASAPPPSSSGGPGSSASTAPIGGSGGCIPPALPASVPPPGTFSRVVISTPAGSTGTAPGGSATATYVRFAGGPGTPPGGGTGACAPPTVPIPPSAPGPSGGTAIIDAKQSVLNSTTLRPLGEFDYLFLKDTDDFLLNFDYRSGGPMVDVSISLEGAHNDFIDRGTAQTIVMRPFDVRGARVHARDIQRFTQPTAGRYLIDEDQLYAARIRVKAEEKGSGRVVFDQEIYVFRFLDTWDARHEDGYIDFPRATTGVVRYRPIHVRLGGLSIPDPIQGVRTGLSKFLYEGANGRFKYEHSGFDEFHESVYEIRSPRGVAGRLTVRAEGGVERYYFDEAAFLNTLERLTYPASHPDHVQSGLSVSYEALLSNPGNRQAILNQTLDYLTEILAPFSTPSGGGIQRTLDSTSADIVIDRFHLNASDVTTAEASRILTEHSGSLLTCSALHPVNCISDWPYGLTFLSYTPSGGFPNRTGLIVEPDNRGVFGGLGPVEVLALDGHVRYNNPERAFRLSATLNQTRGFVNLYLDSVVRERSIASDADRDTVIRSFARMLANAAAHYIGHHAGLVAWSYDALHPWGEAVALDFNEFPAHSPILEAMDGPVGPFITRLPAFARLSRFQYTSNALCLAVGLEWNQQQADDALHYFQAYYRQGGTFDAIPLTARRFFDPSEGAAAKSGTLSDATAAAGVSLSSAQPVLLVLHQTNKAALNRLEFGAINVDGIGAASASTTVLLYNAARGNLTVSNVYLQGVRDFRIAPAINSPTVIAPGASVPLTVSFDALNPGELFDHLVIESDARVPTYVVTLRGEGRSSSGSIRALVSNNNAGGVALGGSAITLSNAITITNLGMAALTISQINMTEGSGEFAISGLPVGFGPGNPITLLPDQVLSFSFSFQPTTSGVRMGTIRIVSDDPLAPTLPVGVIGTGLATPSALQWGDDFVLLEVMGTQTRLRSAKDGMFHFFLPPNTGYVLNIFDPESGLVAVMSGVSGTNAPTTFGQPVFAASREPDRDGNGLPDDIDLITGPGPFFDFGTGESPVAAGYRRVSANSSFESSIGFGWIAEGEAVSVIDRTNSASVLKRDFHAVTHGTFAADQTNGLYDVSLTMGDALAPHDEMKISIEGVLLGNITTAVGEFATVTYRVTVRDGQLNVRLDSDSASGAKAVLNALEIIPVALGDFLAESAPAPGRTYYAVQSLDNDFVLRGLMNLADGESLFDNVSLNPGARYRLWLFNAETLEVGSGEFSTPASGVSFAMPNVILRPATGPDSDGDGLDDVAEFVVGTQVNKIDSDNDGISDLAEVRQGLNPLDDRGFPTGIIASLSLNGEAREVVVESSVANAARQLAYVATGPYGLAIVDVSRFNNPITLGQLRLPGNAVDVAVDPLRQIAVIAGEDGGLHFVDVADPMLPQLIRTIAVKAGQVEVFDGLTYVAVEAALAVYDLLTADRIQLRSLGQSIITGLAREGQMLCGLDTDGVLRVLDIEGPTLAVRGSLLVTNATGKIFVGNRIAYCPVSSGGFATVSLAEPGQPRLISDSDVTTFPGTPRAFAANGSGRGLLLNSATQPTVQLLNLANPTNTYNVLATLPARQSPEGVAIASGIGFIANGPSGLSVLNYLPFDANGLAPTVSISTTAADVSSTNGLQLVAGAVIPIFASILDDVQVSHAELLVDDGVVRNDVSFPFDFVFPVPSPATGSNTIAIRVRATDTGGNSALSNPLIVEVVPDTTPPILLALDPPNASNHPQGTRTVRATFSDSMDAATLTPQTVRLARSSNSAEVLVPIDVQLRSFGRAAQFTYAELLPGDYTLTLIAPQIENQSGLVLGSSNLVSRFSVREAIAVWTNPQGGFWDDPNNWESGALPGPDDRVIINVPGNATIIHRSGTNRIYSLVSSNRFVLSGGTLFVQTTLQVNNTFLITNALSQQPVLQNARVLPGANGQGLIVSNATMWLDGVTLDADATLVQRGNLDIVNGLTLNGSLSFDEPFSAGLSFRFDGLQTLAGTGRVLLGNTGEARLGGNGSLIIGPGITVRGSGFVRCDAELTNLGTIIADAENVNLNVGGNFRTVNSGTMRAMSNGVLIITILTNNSGGISGTNATVLLEGRWHNDGVINASNALVRLCGEFTLADIGAINRVGGSVEICGTLNNSSTVLALNAITGSWELRGRINGGRVTTSGGARLLASAGALEGVTLDGDVDFVPRSLNNVITVFSNLVINGRLTIGDACRLDFLGAQTLGGTGQVLIAASGGILPHSGGPLTIGSGLTVRGSGTIGSVFTTVPVINLGTLAAEGTNTTLTVIATTLRNGGVLTSGSNAHLIVNAAVTNTGLLNPGGTGRAGRITVESNFTQTASGSLSVEIGGASTNQFDRLLVRGGASLDGTLNVAMINGYVPAITNTFSVMTFATRTNDFAVKNGLSQSGFNLVPQFTTTNLLLRVQP